MNRRDFLKGGTLAATAMPLAGFGVAAALAARHGTTPRAVSEADVRGLLKQRGVKL